jgi:DDE superfamily endonuclease
MAGGVPGLAQPLEAWLRPFATILGEPAWRRALVLVAGALLTPGRRTVASALRAAGLEGAPDFAGYHRVLSHARWSGLAVGERLLALLVAAFVPDGPVVVALDDTLERRWGRRIRARGIYRDPVRSSHGHCVKASGLRWLSVMLIVAVPWAGRTR